MIHHLANRVIPAEAWARVLTLGADARPVRGTVGIHRAFGTTAFVRVAYVVRLTRTRTSAVLLATHRVEAAGRRDTGGWFFGAHDLGYKNVRYTFGSRKQHR